MSHMHDIISTFGALTDIFELEFNFMKCPAMPTLPSAKHKRIERTRFMCANFVQSRPEILSQYKIYKHGQLQPGCTLGQPN